MSIFQIIYKNPKIRFVFAVCVCLWLAMALQVVVSLALSKDISITEAFAVSDNVTIKDYSIDSTACLSLDRQSFDYKAEEVLRKIFDRYACDIKYTDNPIPCYMGEYETDNSILSGTVSRYGDMNAVYLHLTYESSEKICELGDDYRQIEMILDTLKKEGTIHDRVIYVRINAFRCGRMGESDCKAYTETIFGRLGAGYVMEGGAEYYTQYGYARKITEAVKSGENTINVQVSFGYNEENNTTEISLGSPILYDNY